MAAEPHRAGPVSGARAPVSASEVAPPSAASEGLPPAYVVDLSVGPVRRLEYRSLVPGHVTCRVQGAELVGSAGVPLFVEALATAATADEARHLALGKALARHAVGFWDPAALSKHPPQPPHGTGPGPWVRMWVGEGQREVWMPAARVYAPFRLGNGRLVGDGEGLACAGSLDAARAGAQVEQVRRRALQPLWQALERHKRAGEPVPVPDDGVRDLVVGHAQGLSLALSFQWSLAGPVFGVAGLGCAVGDEQALVQARSDRAHTEALLRLQQAGVWGGLPQDRPLDMDARVHRLAWRKDEALAMATLVNRWRARAKPATNAAQRTGLAWADLTPPTLYERGLWVVRALWLDGEGGGLSWPAPPSPPH